MILNPFIFSVAGSGFDADADAFITAAAITNSTQQTALNQLVLDLKAASIWTKFNAIYPMIGGTAASHKFNLKDPRDLDAAFRLVFSGGWTHSATGALPNGSTAYADTRLNPASVLTANSTALCYYSRTDQAAGVIGELGCSTGASELPICAIWIKRAGDLFFSDQYDYNSGQRVSAASSDSRGLFVGSRTSNVMHKAYRNGVLLATVTATVSQVLPSEYLHLGAYKSHYGILNHSAKECALAAVAGGLTDAENTDFYTAVQTYQTALGRNV